MSMPPLKAWRPFTYDSVLMNWYVLLMRYCGRFTASPMAVRLFAALKPTSPSSLISIDGISSDEVSAALVVVSRNW